MIYTILSEILNINYLECHEDLLNFKLLNLVKVLANNLKNMNKSKEEI